MHYIGNAIRARKGVGRMSRFIEELLKSRLIDVGDVRIARATLTGVRGKARYIIYLPMARNYLWRLLNEAGEKVRLYVEVPEGVLTKLRARS